MSDEDKLIVSVLAAVFLGGFGIGMFFTAVLLGAMS